MRVLAVTPYYEPEGGGLERYAHAVLRRLAARGHEARVLCFTRGGERDAPLDGVDVIRLAPRWRLSNTPIDPAFARRVREEVRAFGPDVLYAHTPVPFPAEAAWWAARNRVPIVLTYHAGRLEGGSPALDALAALDRWTVERAMLADAQALIAVSPFVRDHALARHRAALLPPGVDLGAWEPGQPSGSADVLFVGPLAHAYRWKGLDVLWAAMRRVAREVPDARLVLVGDGDRRAALERRARAEPFQAVFRGRLPQPELAQAHRSAAVTVLPSTSRAESFGMVLAEANACARPVVGARVGGIPDFVEDGHNGLLVDPGDPEALAEGVVRLLRSTDEAAAMGARGRAKVEAAHDWDRLAVRAERLLRSAMG